ncbi:MAG: FAD-dependent oxidoreductase [Crocinitomicaceae bacterium]|jgi:glycine/D-amino acid oxidase-like deaminating enzyme|tara:strand:- start:11999 stop:13039 length:1041 start_codon:yes stop_codon:yes gene_type:complete
MMKKILIIGGGVAGGSLAIQLIKKGVEVRVIDRGDNHSSLVASGMVNPMVFRRMNLSWRVQELLPYARRFYLELEKKFDTKFFNELKIRRFFSSAQERGFWETKQHETAYQDYLTIHDDFDESIPNSKNEFGSGLVKSAFWIHPEVFMKQLHAYLISKGVLSYAPFDVSSLELETCTYKTKSYDAIVFCCGADNDALPFFTKANIQHNRGQMLKITSKNLSKNESWNKKGFLLPLGGNEYKLGATYEWNEPSLEVTAEARAKLELTLKAISDADYTVEEQYVGIRPTVADRRPVMGEHPEHNGLYIFNGLGTKGYMLAPLLSLEMADYILAEKPLHKEVLFSRLYK